MKKLLVTASTFPRWHGDTEPRFVLDLCKALSECFDVTVLAPACPEAKDQEILEGVKVIRYHYFPIHKWETLCYPGAIVPRIKEKKIRALLVPFLFLGLWWKLFRILKNYDVVHAHWIIPQGIIQSFFKKPYLITGHGGDVLSMNKGIVKLLKIRSLKLANAITFVSEQLKSDLTCVDGFNKDELLNKIKIIPMGCNTSNFGKEYRLQNYFKQNTDKVILFVGRLEKIKGVQYLIEAMSLVDARLVIVGDGSQKEKLHKLALLYKDKIDFIGAKTHDELKYIYASADVFVAPSITMDNGDKEGFGLVLLEAMSSGLPVIASKSGGMSSLVKTGINGYLVEEKNSNDIADKINMLLNDEHLYSQIVNGAIETAQKYDYKEIASKYKNILEVM